MNYLRPTFAEVDLSALRHNIKWLRERAGKDNWFCPMVKANAYGHGAAAIGRVLEDLQVNALGVALVEEGVELRVSGVRAPILVFGLFSDSAIDVCLNNKLTPVLSRWHDLEVFEKRADAQFGVHLKFNTGMNRLGFEPADAVRVAEFFRHARHLKLEGICSHLMQGEDWHETTGFSVRQGEALKAAAAAFAPGPVLHLLNSSALLSAAGTRGFGVRPGIAIYGAGFPNESSLRPVMHLRSEVALLHHLKAQEGVSYNARWRAPRESVVATVPIGYGDGFFRILTNRTEALVRGQRVPLVGTVCMDYIILDVTNLGSGKNGVQPGEPVTLWGLQGDHWLKADEVAERAETISYEVFTAVSPRVPRRYRDGD